MYSSIIIEITLYKEYLRVKFKIFIAKIVLLIINIKYNLKLLKTKY